MLVYDLRQNGMGHTAAIGVAGVSDKGGKNAVRVVRCAELEVVNVLRSGLASISVADAMQVMDFPAEIQRAAVAEVKAGKAKKLQSTNAVTQGNRVLMRFLEMC